MSSPTPTRRISRRTLVLAATALVAVLVAVVVALTVGPDREGTAASASASASPSGSASAVSASPPPASSAPPPTPVAGGSTDDVDSPPTALPAVALDDQASAGQGISARLTDVSVVEVTGQGAGSVSGRALRVTVELINGSTSELSLSGVDVTADTGPAHDPASPVDDGRTRGLGGSVPAGAAAAGTYLFSLPDDADTATVLVGYQAGASLMVFSGPIG